MSTKPIENEVASEAQKLDEPAVWYKCVAYEDAKGLVKENLMNTVAAFIAAGYWLKCIRDSRDYEMDGYTSLWECAESEFGLKVSEASRAMSMNDKYSVDGDSPIICDIYKQYNKSQLQEMLTMSEEQIGQVTPDMSIKDIRKIKNPDITKVIAAHAEEIRHEAAGAAEPIKERKSQPIPPEVKGLMDDPYCSVCGAPLNSMDEACDACGQAVDWTGYIKEFCDVATDSVMTESEEDSQDGIVEDILTDIEIAPEQEEEISVEFDTDELLQELDDYIEGEYREVPEEPDGSPDKEAAETEELSAYGLPKTEYPEGSLLTTEGCGHKYDCFCCAQDCDMRQKKRYCLTAPMGNPYNCTTMNVLENLKADIGDKCQFINLDMAEHTVSGEPVPCCEECQESGCGYRCRISALEKNDSEKEITETVNENQDVAEESDISDYAFLTNLLEKEKDKLNEFIKVDEVEKLPDKLIRKQKLIVGALANMKCELDDMAEADEDNETVQPELPQFKNDNQRKAWIEDVEAWGLWYEDHNIQAKYYKYDFADGSRLIAVKYRYTCPPLLEDSKEFKELDGDYRDVEYHMIYSEEYKKKYPCVYDGYYKYYTHATASITGLVDFMKKIAKRQQA